MLRGKTKDETPDVVDWAVGATENTKRYASDNKSRLGAAGAGGAAMIDGTMLAGPIGGVVAGIATQVVAGKAIEKVEAKLGKPEEQKNESSNV